MGGFKSRRGIKTNRSQLLALLTSTCVALTSQSIAAQTVVAQSKSTVGFNIKPTNGSVDSANSSQHGEPIRISLPIAAPASTPRKQTAPLPTMLPQGLPATLTSQPTADMNLGVPSNSQSGKVQMRLSSEEPPKLPVSVTNSIQETVRLNVASEVPPTLSLPLQPPKNQTMLHKPEGPVKFNVGDTGVKDFGIQRTNTAPALLSRAPELVKPKKFSVSQTVVLARSSDLSEGTNAEIDRQEVLRPEIKGQDVVKQSVSEVQSESSLEAESREKPISSGVVLLTKPSKTKSSADRNFVGLASSSTASDPEVRNLEGWQSVEVEREYDIEILGTYSIDAPFEIARIETQDPECCGVFNNGRAITVVGKTEGCTKVAIISKDHQRRVVGVKVLPTGQQPATPKSDLDQVKEMITNLFPEANLSFNSQDSGGIEVRGTTKSEAEARKVLELVRRICLVPVEDKVKVLP